MVSHPQKISSDLKQVLRRLKLSPMLETLPERLELARQHKTPYQDFLLVVLSDEAERRDGNAVRNRAVKAKLEPDMRLENWDDTAEVTFDSQIWAELCTLRFGRSCHNVADPRPRGGGQDISRQHLGADRVPPGAVYPDDVYREALQAAQGESSGQQSRAGAQAHHRPRPARPG